MSCSAPFCSMDDLRSKLSMPKNAERTEQRKPRHPLFIRFARSLSYFIKYESTLFNSSR